MVLWLGLKTELIPLIIYFLYMSYVFMRCYSRTLPEQILSEAQLKFLTKRIQSRKDELARIVRGIWDS